MHAEIVMIGTELLLGELVDTNANLLAKALREIGLDLYYKATVGDNETRIAEVLDIALNRSDVVITSGGIGPTVDDVTRQAVAAATGRKLVYSSDLEEQVAARFRSFGRRMTENNRRQAYIPEGALPLHNPAGTAPCFLSEDTKGRGFIISLPGVPRELDYMMKNRVAPILVERMGGMKVTRIQILRTCAVGESNVDRAIGDLMTSVNPTVGLAAHAGQTDVRVTAKADTKNTADALIASMEVKIRERLGVAVYGTAKETVSEVVGRLLTEKNLKLGIIDTLTCGQLALDLIEAGFGHLLTRTLSPADLSEASRNAGLESTLLAGVEDYGAFTLDVAKAVSPTDGLGMALLGPFEDNSTEIALYGPRGLRLSKPSRNYRNIDYVHRWIVIQGLDWIRRLVLNRLTSPVD